MSTSSFLHERCSRVGLSHGLQDKLIQLTQNQGVLLGEFTDRDLKRLAIEFPGSLQSLHAVRESSISVLGISTSPHRFLPWEVHQLALVKGLRWDQLSIMARPPHWSWVDVLSAQGPISAAGITVAMEMVFQESKYFQQSSLASWTALVEHSGYSHLVPRWSPDEASTDHPAWSEASGLNSALERSTCSQSILINGAFMGIWLYSPASGPPSSALPSPGSHTGPAFPLGLQSPPRSFLTGTLSS